MTDIHSRIYSGSLSHCRHIPVVNRFRYDLFMLYLNLDEVDEVFSKYWLWSSKGINFAWFRRADHSGDVEQPLVETIRDMVGDETGNRPRGPVFLLTNLRYLFYKSNPVSFYYCFEGDGKTLQAIVAEVTNTPWGERYCYVLGEKQRAENTTQYSMHYRTDKQFTVSPFMPMDMHYEFYFSLPAKTLGVQMESYRQGVKVFEVDLALVGDPINSSSLSRQLIRLPLMTAKITAAIYWQALRLFLKRVPFLGHGGKG